VTPRRFSSRFHDYDTVRDVGVAVGRVAARWRAMTNMSIRTGAGGRIHRASPNAGLRHLNVSIWRARPVDGGVFGARVLARP
jgi:hypothetical protein